VHRVEHQRCVRLHRGSCDVRALLHHETKGFSCKRDLIKSPWDNLCKRLHQNEEHCYYRAWLHHMRHYDIGSLLRAVQIQSYGLWMFAEYPLVPLVKVASAFKHKGDSRRWP
jgi:hypothetical protein